MSDKFRRQCRVLRLATQAVFAGLLALLASGAAGVPWWPPGATLPESRALQLALYAVHALPALGYLWALYSVQRALGDLAAGRTFQPTLSRALRHTGIGVLAGALLNVFVVINLTHLVLDVRGSYAYFDLSAIVLGVVGAALMLLAHVADEGRRLQSELDEIF